MVILVLKTCIIEIHMHFIQAKSILSPQNGMNLYRGCTHGCIYCDSRSLCYHTPVPFEDIEVKENAVELLETRLKSKRKKCMIGTGAMCDPYMHYEKDLQLTRRCLEVIDRYGFGLAIQTKSDLILRDIDLLESINKKAKCVVEMTLTTFDEDLCRIIEPNVCSTHRRFEVLKEMQARGIPTIVWMTPDLPFINDTEENLRGILGYCKDAGVKGIIKFDFGVTLREGDREYLYSAFDKHFPGMKERYIHTYGNAYQVGSPNRSKLMKIFREWCRENNMLVDNQCFEYMREFPSVQEANIAESRGQTPEQLELVFDKGAVPSDLGLHDFSDILIGTSGYDHPELKGSFYPADLPRKDFLAFYSTKFNALELNSTFYGMPTARRIDSIYERSGGRLKFSIKLNQLLTHQIGRDWREQAGLFKTAMNPLLEKDVLATVLVQFPESFYYTKENRVYLSELLKVLYPLPCVVEFRHRDWIKDSVFEGLATRNAGIVFCDMPQLKNLPDGFTLQTPFIGPNAYIKLHGRNQKGWYAQVAAGEETHRYDYEYSKNELMSFIPIIEKACVEGKRIQLYFNNHPKGIGFKNALELSEMIRSRACKTSVTNKNN